MTATVRRLTRPVMTTVQVRAVEVTLDDVVMHDGHAWMVLEGDAYRADGTTVDDWTDKRIVAVRTLLTRPRFTWQEAEQCWKLSPPQGWHRGELQLGADDLVTVQAKTDQKLYEEGTLDR